MARADTWIRVTAAVVESNSDRIGLINLVVKCAGARSEGNPHAACEVAGTGNGATDTAKRARKGKPRIQPSQRPDGPPRQFSTLPRYPDIYLRRRSRWLVLSGLVLLVVAELFVPV